MYRPHLQVQVQKRQTESGLINFPTKRRPKGIICLPRERNPATGKGLKTQVLRSFHGYKQISCAKSNATAGERKRELFSMLFSIACTGKIYAVSLQEGRMLSHRISIPLGWFIYGLDMISNV